MRERLERRMIHMLRENTSNQEDKQRIERDLRELKQRQKLEEEERRAANPTGVRRDHEEIDSAIRVMLK